MVEDTPLRIGLKTFESRLFVGTGKLSDSSLIREIIDHSGAQMVTVAIRRIDFDNRDENIVSHIPKTCVLLPNTSGARNAKEAVRLARIARETGYGDFIKIEIINDQKYLMPDNEETIEATKQLFREGFVVLPYVMADVVTCRKLEDAGASAVMPLGSPIGSNRGIRAREFLRIIIENANIPVIIDAGIGKPSHAAEAMEMGADAVLVNTAIATSKEIAMVSRAFGLAVQAGRMGYLAGLREALSHGEASSPLTGFLRQA
jgi:thiazole synthase